MEGHERYIELISQSIDGLPDHDSRRELEEHLAVCPDCAELFDILSGVHRVLDFELEPPKELVSNVMASVAGERAARRRARRRWTRAVGGLAAAAVIAVAVLPRAIGASSPDAGDGDSDPSGISTFSLPRGAETDDSQTPAVCMVPEDKASAYALGPAGDFDAFAESCYAVAYFEELPQELELEEPVAFTNGASGRYITLEQLEAHASAADRIDYHDPDSAVIIAVTLAEQ